MNKGKRNTLRLQDFRLTTRLPDWPGLPPASRATALEPWEPSEVTVTIKVRRSHHAYARCGWSVVGARL